MQKILYFKSDDIVQGNTSKGIIQYNQQIDHNVNYVLYEFVMNNNLYNVNDTNNKVYFDEGGGTLTATLTNGNYFQSDFTTELQTQLNAIGADTYTCTYSNTTGKITVVDTTGTFGFVFLTNTTNTARYLLGLEEENQSVLATQITGVLDLDDTNKHIRGQKYFGATFVISNNSPFADVIRYKKNENYAQYIKLTSSSTIHFRFIDKFEQPIDLNNASWEIFLKRIKN